MAAPGAAGGPEPGDRASWVLERETFDRLFAALRERGYEVIGPKASDGAIVYGAVGSVEDLPKGWTDEQAGGSYRLVRQGDESLFGFTLGPLAWKRVLHPPTAPLLEGRRENGLLRIRGADPGAQRAALLGVRACELAAIRVQDRVLLEGPAADPHYAARRRGAFIIAVQCGRAGKTCFCASMGAGPRAREGFDLALTEVLDGADHWFLVETGSEAGAELLAALRLSPATGRRREAAASRWRRAETGMGRTLETAGLSELLRRRLEDPRWESVARRCLACGNCTAVCPTCFCTTTEDAVGLGGATFARARRWDSCFSLGFSYLHGGSVRSSVRSRYRQWMTHKLAHWEAQFGVSGCVGCGRCIAWCPVGIDITEEALALRASDAPARTATAEGGRR